MMSWIGGRRYGTFVLAWCSPLQKPKWPLGCPLPIEKRPLPSFFLAALKRAEAAAIGRSLRSLFRALPPRPPGTTWLMISSSLA